MLNIVDPTSTIKQETAPFALVGNRGILHEGNRIVRHSRKGDDDWLYCVTSALSDPREFMRPERYTDLFFLDEATALAAGHRPCGQCNKARFKQFVRAWEKAHNVSKVSAHQIDSELQAHRVRGTKQVTFQANVADLPSGVMIREVGQPDPLLLFRYEPKKGQEIWCVYPWTSQGYGIKRDVPECLIEVLTPRPIVEVIRAGFKPGPNDPLLAW